MAYTITWKDGSTTQMDDSEFASMPKEMEKDIGDISQSSPAPSTYQFQPGQREDLLANLHEVGYSGLDDAQKALYKQQYDASDYAKAGHSFQEAIDLADRSARSQSGISFDTEIRNPIEAWKNIRGLVSKGLSPIGAAIGELYDKAEGGRYTSTIGPYGKEIAIPVEESFVDRMKRLETEGHQNEGLMGVVSDPMNLVGAGVGKGITQGTQGTLGPVGRWLSLKPAIGGSIEGAVLGGGGSVLDGGDVSDAALSSILGGTVGGIGGFLRPATADKLKDYEQQALKEFPGNRYFQTQANKGGLHLSESAQYLTDAEKLDILKGVSDIASGKKADIDAWIDYNRSVQKARDEAYKVAERVATRQNESAKITPDGWVPRDASITIDELSNEMKSKLAKGIGPYSKAESDKFVDDILAGYKEKYGNDLVSIGDLSEIKGRLNQDIFDPRFSVAKGTTNERAMARKAGSVISDLWNTRKMIGIGPEVPGNAIEIPPYNKDYKRYMGTYNEIAGEAGRKAHRQSEIIEDIFQHQRIPTASQRTAAGDNIRQKVINSILSGGKKVYTGTGDAYADPVELFRKARGGVPSKKAIIGGSFLSGISPMVSDIPKSNENKKKKK